MQMRRWWTVPVLAGCLLAAPGGARAQEKAAPPDLERKQIDNIVYKTLRTVINQGADLYNSGDWAGCFRLYEGSLLTVRPLLDHHPALQKAIDAALVEAARTPMLCD